jgi:hypothetical protein
MDVGVLMSVVWALASLAVWGSVFRDSLGYWHRYHDRRAKREVIYSFALFLVGFCSFIAILALVAVPDGRGLRALLTALSLGSFLGAGIVVKTLSGPNNETRR